MYNEILEKIKKCEQALSTLGSSAQAYITAHDIYIEKKIKDADIIKKKMIEKVARVLHED